MIYQLTYELRTSDKDYSDFFTFLEQGLGGDALHVLRDAWWLAVDDEWDIKRLCEEIRPRLGDMDVFFVTEIPIKNINGWMHQTAWKWYKDHKE